MKIVQAIGFGFIGVIVLCFLMGSGVVPGAYNTIENNGTPLTKRSILNFPNSGCADNSGNQSTDCTFLTAATVPGNYTQSFVSQTSVTLTHNLNTTAVIVQCYDAGSPPALILPNTTKITDANDVTVTFSASQSGKCQVSGSNGSGSSSGGTGFGGTVVAPVPANWSGIGSGCATSTVTGITAGAALQVVSSSGTQNICGYQISVSAGNFSHLFTYYGILSANGLADVVVGFTDGTQAEMCGPGSSTGGATISGGGWASIINYKSSTLNSGSLSGANGASAYFLPNWQGGPVFLRLSRTGTNLACDFSPDGVNYFNMFNDTSPFLTASALIFAADPRGATSTSAGILESYQ